MMAISCSVCSIPDWSAHRWLRSASRRSPCRGGVPLPPHWERRGLLDQHVEASALGLPRALLLAHLPDGVVNARNEVRIPPALDLLVAEGPLLVEQDAPALLEFCACRLPGLLHVLQGLLAEPDLFGESRETLNSEISRNCSSSCRLVRFSFACVCAARAQPLTRCVRSSVECCTCERSSSSSCSSSSCRAEVGVAHAKSDRLPRERLLVIVTGVDVGIDDEGAEAAALAEGGPDEARPAGCRSCKGSSPNAATKAQGDPEMPSAAQSSPAIRCVLQGPVPRDNSLSQKAEGVRGFGRSAR